MLQRPHQLRADVAERARAPCRRRSGDRRRDRRGSPTRVGQREPALGERAGRLVREARRDGRGRLGVVLGAEVRPGAPTGLLAEALLEAPASAGPSSSSLPPPLPKMPPISDASAITSVRLPRLRQLAERRVLRRHHDRVGERRVDVGVDPGDEVWTSLDELRALGAVELSRAVDLLLEVLLGVGGELPLDVVHGAVGRRAADERRELGAARCGAGRPSGRAGPGRPRSPRRTSTSRACRRRCGEPRTACRG